ncbi:S-layer homology domain-containing protein [Flavonifractor plautii]|nr:S-layer homology domain-containing protein [Flavonifractor plautii]
MKVSPTRASKGSTVTVTVKPDEGYELDELTVTDKNGDSVRIIKSNGKYTFKMPASKVTVEAVFTAVEAKGLPSFTDVTSGDWFYDAVAYVYDKGMMEGTTDTTFAPTMNLTRSMIAQVLYNLEERPEAPARRASPTWRRTHGTPTR